MIIEKLLLKKRFVFSNAKIPNGFQETNLHHSFKVITSQDFVNNDISYILNSTTFQHKQIIQKLLKRLKKNHWVLFILISKETDELSGYYWAICGLGFTRVHDNFLIEGDSSLLCNAFVEPNYRNKSLYKYLIHKAHSWLKQADIKKTFTIVESGNIYSLRANASAGLNVCGTNYLIKLLGMNLLSIYRNTSGITHILSGQKLGNKTFYKSKKECLHGSPSDYL
jgi:GNAT superfamily N-acetyltransferase